MFDHNMKPKAILINLVKKGLEPPPKSKLINFLTKLRREKYGSDKLDFGKLEKWLSENMEMPAEDNQPFVLDYEVKIDEENVDKSIFRFCVSTKYLLRHASSIQILHSDATYKLIWQGFPVLLVGTTDADRRFHPIAVCVATNEREEDFSFFFRALRNSVKQLLRIDLKPRVLICDAAKSIQNAFKSIFGCSNIIMCWAHVRRNVVKNLPKYIRDRKKQAEFLSECVDIV